MSAAGSPLDVLRHRCPHMPGEPCDCPDKDAALSAFDALVEKMTDIATRQWRDEGGRIAAAIARDALARFAGDGKKWAT